MKQAADIVYRIEGGAALSEDADACRTEELDGVARGYDETVETCTFER